jgi:CheY-specific phosphatase CheX
MKALNAELVAEHISAAVTETFRSMLQVNTKLEACGKHSESNLKADVSGILTLSQKDAGGLLVISFPKQTICEIVSKFYGKKITAVDQSVNMAVGELTNVIYCAAKKVLNEEGFELGMAIPSIIVGNQHFVFAHFSGEITEQEFSTEFGKFKVYTCLKNRIVQTRAA